MPTQIREVLPWLRPGVVLVLIATIVTSIGVYSRTIFNVPEQSYLHVFLWQMLAWLPWLAIAALARVYLDRGARAPVPWVVSSFLVAFGCTIWFIFVSDQVSPYLGQPETMFGLFKWFLIFWFAISFLLFWAFIGFCLLQMNDAEGRDVQSQKDDDRRIAIWHNGGHIVVPKDEIVWIEAKDYYAQIHMTGGQAYWVKMRLNQLMKELASDRFVRVHRSAIINLNHLERIDRESKQGWEAVLKLGHRVRLSRSGKAMLEEALNLIR